MKTARLFLILLLTQALSYAGDTAYQALRLIGKGNQDVLNHVISVEGVNGQPQPLIWTISIDDPAAHGGVRVLEISNGRIISEHTPVRGYAGAAAVMDFKRLNLDSAGAFTIANQEAAKRNTGFDSLDYVLRSDPQTGAPIWFLKLIDVNHVLVGTISIGADNGTVLNTAGFAAAAAPPTAADTPPPGTVPAPGTAVVPPPPPPNGNVPPDQEQYGVGHQINKGLHRIGADLQQFFTGKRTWDQKFQNEP